MKEQYYPPPPVFIGGSGPYLPRKLPPSVLAVPEDNPPFSGERAVAIVALVVSLWQPSGLGLPQQRPRFVPQGSTSDAPPPTRSLATYRLIIQSWQPGPPTPQAEKRVAPDLFAVPENNPPFGQRRWFDGVRRQWEPGPPQPQSEIRSAGVASTADTVTLDPRHWLSGIVATWPPPAWWTLPRKLNPSVLAVPEDAPPVLARGWLPVVLRAWQLEAPLRQILAKLPPVSAPADNPPFGLSRIWLPSIVRAWQPGPPRPQAKKLNPPSILAVPVNEPPYGQRRWLSAVLRAWQPIPALPTLPIGLVSGFVLPGGPQPPDFDRKLQSMSRVPERWRTVDFVNRGRDRSFSGLLNLPYGQIKFPNPPNPSTDPSTFDAYLEGAWVPVDDSGAALVLTVTSATFVRKGSECSIWLDITYPVTADASAVRIGALPFLAHLVQNSALALTVFAPLTLSAFADSNTTQIVLFNNITSAFAINSQLSGVQLLIGGVVKLAV